jgi:hypothetical protein
MAHLHTFQAQDLSPTVLAIFFIIVSFTLNIRRRCNLK